MPPKKKLPDKKDNPPQNTTDKADTPKKKPPIKYWAFRMITGEIEYIENKKKEAEAFEEENKAIIDSKHTFEYKKHFKAFKQTASLMTPNSQPMSTPNKQPMTDNVKAMLQQALVGIENDIPSDRIHLWYRTNPRATILAIIIRFMQATGKDDWKVKADNFAVAIRNHVVVFGDANMYVEEAFKNMKWGKMRDLSGPEDKVMMTHWTSPTSKATRDFPNNVAWTYITIPVDEIATTAAETSWIMQTAENIGATIKQVLLTNTFEACFEKATNNPNIWRAITDEKNPAKNYQKFIEGCRIKVEECNNLNEHLTLHDGVKQITTLLFNSRLKERKYPEEDKEEEDEEEEDDDEDESSSDGGQNNKATFEIVGFSNVDETQTNNNKRKARSDDNESAKEHENGDKK